MAGKDQTASASGTAGPGQGPGSPGSSAAPAEPQTRLRDPELVAMERITRALGPVAEGRRADLLHYLAKRYESVLPVTS